MDEYRLTECVLAIMNNRERSQFTHKERTIARVIAAEIKRINNVEDNVFEKLAKTSSTCNINAVMEEMFREGVINLGRIMAAYGYIVYAVGYNISGKDVVLDEFNDFYKKRLKSWLDSQDIWNSLYRNTHPALCVIF